MIVKCGIVPDYFLDSMDWHEVALLLDQLEYSNRDSWEQTRLQMWAVLQSQSSKRIKVTDVLPFSWDKTKEVKEITRNDIEEFKRRNNLK